MGKRFIISESEKNDIRKMYGLIKEQNYMKKYSGSLLDFCGYRAIEEFEETMGNPNGKSMGQNYFEQNVDSYENLIKSNIEDTISVSVFQTFPAKLKMQIWSFMFNSTDASNGTVKWLAGLAQAMGLIKNSDAKSNQEYRLRVMDENSKEYSDAINNIKNFKGSWGTVYGNYLNVLDEQYKSTAMNNKLQGSYANSWKFRPTKLDELYNTCGGGGNTNQQQIQPNQQPQTNQQSNQTNQQPSNKPTISYPFKVNYSTIATDTDNFN